MKKLILLCFLLLSETISFGQYQNALHFDGINDAVSLPASTHSQIANQGTIEAWINTTANNSGFRGLVVRSTFYGLFLVDNKLSTFIWGGSTPGVVTYNGANLNDSLWHHVAFSFQVGVTGGSQMYLDGQPVGPAITLQVGSTPNSFQLGCNTNQQYYSGKMDDVKIWSRALSAQELANSRVCSSNGTTGLVGSYSFNSGNPSQNNTGLTTLTDNSGSNNNGTLLNFALNGSTSNWVDGNFCCLLSRNISGTTSYCVGQTINLTASFGTIPGESITSYQWKKNGVNLTNGGNISGATSANLQIANLVSSDFDTYSVEVTSTCGTGLSSVNITESGIIDISNLTAYYPFNNGSSADSSGNNYVATSSATTSAANRFNQPNSAFSFNGTSSVVTIAAPTGQTILGNGRNKSISLWFKRSSTTSKGILIGYQQASPGNWNPLAYIGSDGVLRGWMYQGGVAAWTSNITIDTNWHHLALVYTTNTQTAYLDGSQVATMNGALSPGASNIIQIGNGYANTGIVGISSNGNQPFSGLIDEVRFYNAVLSLTEINTLRTSPFLISTQPQNQSVCVGDTASFSLNVLTPEAGSTLAYQWTFNGTPLSNGGSISGANTNNLQISNTQASNAGTYNCIVSPGCNEATSASVTLTLGSGNVNITQQPQNTSVCLGSSASLSIMLMGATVTYQWKKDGVNISGATNSTLNLTNVNSSNAGNYTVDIFGGSCGTVASQVATLTVLTLPTAVITTATPSICQGEVATLTASGGSSYVWVGTLGISGDTQIVTPSSTTTYIVTVTNANGCQASTSQTITVINTPSPTGSSVQTFCSGSTVSDLNVTGTSIAWYANSIGGAPLAASDPLGNETYYASQTVNGCESITRLGVAVTVTVVNADITQSGITLTATQSGANYTWVDCSNGNQPIAGANGQSYTPTENGNYAVIVEQNVCTVTSNCVAITTVGLEDVKEGLFRVYPNPASTEINVELDKTTAIRMVDVTGKLLLELNGASIYSIDVKDLSPGMYIIESAEGAKAKFIKK